MIFTAGQIKQLSKFCGYSESVKLNGISIFKDMVFVSNKHMMIRAKLSGSQGNERNLFISDYFIDEILGIVKTKKVKLFHFIIRDKVVNVSNVDTEEILLKFPVDEPNFKMISKANHYFNQSITTEGEVYYSQIDIDYVLESIKAFKKIITDDFQIEFSIYPSYKHEDTVSPMTIIADNGDERIEAAIMPIDKPVLKNNVFNSSKYKPKLNLREIKK